MGNEIWTPGAHGLLSRRAALALGLAGTAWAARPGRALAQPAPKPPTKPTGQVIVGLSQEPTVFNPLMPHIEVDQGVHWNVFSPLWNVDAKGNFNPQLAAEVPTLENGGVSADGLDWRIKLRSGVTWHDGAPFTADDVKFTLELINNPHFRAFSRNGHSLVTDIKVVSPTEITWRMRKSYAPYPSILSWTFIVPQHLLGKADDPILHLSTMRRLAPGRSAGASGCPAITSPWCRMRISSGPCRISSAWCFAMCPT